MNLFSTTETPLLQVEQLDMGYRSGADRLLLRFPMVVAHVITADSPLASWLQGPSALHADADSEIVVVVSFAALLMRGTEVFL